MRIKILYKIHELDISTFDDFLDVWNPFLHHVVVMLPCSIRSKMAVVGGRRVGDGPKQYWNMNGMESNQMESNRFESNRIISKTYFTQFAFIEFLQNVDSDKRNKPK